MERPEYFCQGCGSLDVTVSMRGLRKVFCAKCWDILETELRLRREAVARGGMYDPDNKGPYFGLSAVRPEGTIGGGLYVSRTPAEAVAESMRVCMQQGWKLLRVDVQGASRIEGLRTCDDIYRSPDYQKHFPGTPRSKGLKFDEKRWGVLPLLWPGQEVPTAEVLQEMEQLQIEVKREPKEEPVKARGHLHDAAVCFGGTAFGAIMTLLMLTIPVHGMVWFALFEGSVSAICAVLGVRSYRRYARLRPAGVAQR